MPQVKPLEDLRRGVRWQETIWDGGVTGMLFLLVRYGASERAANC
jgi:hypothetical protein